MAVPVRTSGEHLFVHSTDHTLTSNEKGNIAEAAIALAATKLGIEVLKPVAEHGRYDLAGAMQMGPA